jgi:hypothetical protein
MKILKNSLILIVVFSMVFTMSCANSTPDYDNTDQCTVMPLLIADYDASHTVGNFEVTVDAINLVNTDASISLTVYNNSTKIASCDKSFDVEKLHEGHWDTCKIEEPEYPDHEQGIRENSSAQVTYNWGDCFDISTPGSYRFQTNLYSDPVNNSIKNELIIEFEINYDKVQATVVSYSIAKGSAFITVNWNNTSDKNIYLTDNFTVKALDDGEWVDCSRTETDLSLSLFAVAAGESAEKHYNIDEIYELNYYGSYRVFLEYSVLNGDNTEIRCAVVEFFIPFDLNNAE